MSAETLRLPRGELVRSRVVSDPATALGAALERGLTGYAVLEPQETLLLDGDAAGVLTFDDGVPVLAYHTESDRGGPAALADLAEPGPYRADLYALDATDLAPVHDTPELEVPPGMPAERLAGDPDLADRTRAAAPDDRLDDADEDPVASFLEDEAKIEAIQAEAREEARERAAEWGLDDELV
ncbi:hypothetical protein BRC81_11835 [Halobacteriales archaeon QS_1_68_20]|nr:MAG: hypothetical protein BRC81_11835 [Halobacteriales archaeon QS_1_68_20]